MKRKYYFLCVLFFMFFPLGNAYANDSSNHEVGRWVVMAQLHTLKGEYSEALRLFRKAAEQGSAHAQFNLGHIYANGKGTEQNYEEAARWFRKASEQGDAGAQNNLGWMYDSGLGVLQDNREAVMWFRKAAEQNHSDAQHNLGVSYVMGKGIIQDYVQAHMFFNLAAANGHHVAREKRDRLAEILTSEQLAEAQKQAREWTTSISSEKN